MENKDEPHPTWMDAVYDRWAKLFGTISTIFFLSFILAAFLRWDTEWMILSALLFALLQSGRIFWLMRAIRKGKARPVKIMPRQRLVSAWLSVGWFFIFGVIGLFLTVGAPWYVSAVLWGVIGLSVAGGVWLLARKR